MFCQFTKNEQGNTSRFYFIEEWVIIVEVYYGFKLSFYYDRTVLEGINYYLDSVSRRPLTGENGAAVWLRIVLGFYSPSGDSWDFKDEC